MKTLKAIKYTIYWFIFAFSVASFTACTVTKPTHPMQSKPNLTGLSEGVYIQTKNVK